MMQIAQSISQPVSTSFEIGASGTPQTGDTIFAIIFVVLLVISIILFIIVIHHLLKKH
ncbi:MAG: hypothetical protein LKF61_01705 [Eggerthellaceae bacterium]|jgi:hypothetical protein|nr:hypothetical protein [Eggerthellaceae bacterium]